jgi:hypothetical protein
VVQGLLPPPCEYPAICFQQCLIVASRTRTDWLQQCCVRAIQVDPQPHAGTTHVAQHCQWYETICGVFSLSPVAPCCPKGPHLVSNPYHTSKKPTIWSCKPKRRLEWLSGSVPSECTSSYDLLEYVTQFANANVTLRS